MKKQPTTDQQATNAALAALAAVGNAFALGQLWEINKGLIGRQLWQWYEQNRPVADAAGLEFEDLEQEGYFAVKYAVEHYDPTKGNFTTYLSYCIRRQIDEATCGGHRIRTVREDGRVVAVSANPLNNCTSLDTPVGEDDSDSTLIDFQSDPAASQAFQTAEEDIYTEELHAALEEALSKLSEREADILRRRYYEGKSLCTVGEELGVTYNRVRQIENRGFQRMRNNPQLKRWHDDIITTRSWRGTGWNAWDRYGSIEERTVEYLETRGFYCLSSPV